VKCVLHTYNYIFGFVPYSDCRNKRTVKVAGEHVTQFQHGMKRVGLIGNYTVGERVKVTIFP